MYSFVSNSFRDYGTNGFCEARFFPVINSIGFSRKILFSWNIRRKILSRFYGTIYHKLPFIDFNQNVEWKCLEINLSEVAKFL